jgi:hypothetical protein
MELSYNKEKPVARIKLQIEKAPANYSFTRA